MYLHQPNNRSERFPTSPTRSRKPCLRPGSPLAHQLVAAPRSATLRSRSCETDQLGDCGRWLKNDQDTIEGIWPVMVTCQANFSLPRTFADLRILVAATTPAVRH